MPVFFVFESLKEAPKSFLYFFECRILFFCAQAITIKHLDFACSRCLVRSSCPSVHYHRLDSILCASVSFKKVRTPTAKQIAYLLRKCAELKAALARFRNFQRDLTIFNAFHLKILARFTQRLITKLFSWSRLLLQIKKQTFCIEKILD